MSLVHSLFYISDAENRKLINIQFTFTETPNKKFLYNKKLIKQTYMLTEGIVKNNLEEVLEEYEYIIDEKQKLYNIMIDIYSKYRVFMYLTPKEKNKYVFLPVEMYIPLRKIPTLQYLAYKEVVKTKYLS